MQKSDSPSAGPASGRLIHELVAGRAATRQCGVEIRHAVADVMDARSPFCKEFRHGTGRVIGFEQLDVDIAKVEADDLGAIDGFGPPPPAPPTGGEAPDLAIKSQGPGDGRPGDADM